MADRLRVRGPHSTRARRRRPPLFASASPASIVGPEGQDRAAGRSVLRPAVLREEVESGPGWNAGAVAAQEAAILPEGKGASTAPR
jgi:hypothetical protein